MHLQKGHLIVGGCMSENHVQIPSNLGAQSVKTIYFLHVHANVIKLEKDSD